MGVSALAEIVPGTAGRRYGAGYARCRHGGERHHPLPAARCEPPWRTLPETAKAEKVKSPAIIIVGKVCAYSNQFDWFDHLPLKGKIIVVTRPKERAGTLSERLRALGANVVEFPCIETHPFLPCPEMEEAVEQYRPL